MSFLTSNKSPGPVVRVILLVHYSVEGLDWLQRKSMPSVIKEQKQVAEKNAFLALEAVARERRDCGFRHLRRPAEEGRKAIYAQRRYRSGHDCRQRQVVDRKAFPELSPLSQLLVRKQIFLGSPAASGYFRARTMTQIQASGRNVTDADLINWTTGTGMYREMIK